VGEALHLVADGLDLDLGKPSKNAIVTKVAHNSMFNSYEKGKCNISLAYGVIRL